MMTAKSLEAQLWTSAVVGSRRCLAKGLFGGAEKAGYEVLLWDNGVMWTERLEEEEIVERMLTLNPNVEAPNSLVLSHLSSLLYSPLTAITEAMHTSDAKTFIVTGSLSGGLPFTWRFYCSRAPDDMVESQLVGPLLSCLSELCQQRQDLVNLVRKKDREIQDYRDGGAVLSRRNLETTPFEEKVFSSANTASQRLQDCVQCPHEALKNDHFQNLYQSIGMATVTMKVSVAAESAEVVGSEIENTNLSPSHLATSLSTPPAKRATPAKDEEMGRREALERKLDEERVRGKKKKKRLM